MSNVVRKNQTEPTVENNEAEQGLPSEARTARRVDVGLRVAIVLGKDTAYMARTVNFSETGILVADYTGPQLAENRLVGVNIRGVISDESADDDPNQYLMRVVRQTGADVALRFVGQPDTV